MKYEFTESIFETRLTIYIAVCNLRIHLNLFVLKNNVKFYLIKFNCVEFFLVNSRVAVIYGRSLYFYTGENSSIFLIFFLNSNWASKLQMFNDTGPLPTLDKIAMDGNTKISEKCVTKLPFHSINAIGVRSRLMGTSFKALFTQFSPIFITDIPIHIICIRE